MYQKHYHLSKTLNFYYLSKTLNFFTLQLSNIFYLSGLKEIMDITILIVDLRKCMQKPALPKKMPPW